MDDRALLPLVVIQQLGDFSSKQRLVGRTRLVKLVFLAQKEAPSAVAEVTGSPEPYPFRRHYYGPYSDSLLEDIRSLVREGLIVEEGRLLDEAGMVVQWEYRVTPKGRERLIDFQSSPALGAIFSRIIVRYGLM